MVFVLAVKSLERWSLVLVYQSLALSLSHPIIESLGLTGEL